MPTQANSWAMYQAVQYLIFTECLVGGVSPFTALSAAANTANPGGVSDLVRYGTNPNGTVTTAVIIGVPKDMTNRYATQCWVVPPVSENVYRVAFGGKSWDYQDVVVQCRTLRSGAGADWYAAQQTLINIRDALYAVMLKHAELPGAANVQASKPEVWSGAPAYTPVVEAGLEWDTWTFKWRLKQEYTIVGGIIA